VPSYLLNTARFLAVRERVGTPITVQSTKDQHSSFTETFKDDRLQVGKGGSPPLKMQTHSTLNELGTGAGVNRPSMKPGRVK